MQLGSWLDTRCHAACILTLCFFSSSSLPLPPAAFTTDFARLSALASAAAQQADPRPPVAVDWAGVGIVMIPAAAVAGPVVPPLPPGIDRPPVVWQQPLPAALRRYLPPEAAAAVASMPGGSRRSEPLPVGAPPAEAEVAPSVFQPRQYGQLHRLIHQHAQLLLQVHLLASSSTDPAHVGVAEQARQLAEQLHAFGTAQAAARQAQVLSGEARALCWCATESRRAGPLNQPCIP